jgi:hypothetical protein
MSKYVYIENNEIISEQDLLPKHWKNVTNFYLMANNLKFINSYGWYTKEQYEETKRQEEELKKQEEIQE